MHPPAPSATARIDLREALARVSDPTGERSTDLFDHGTLRVKIYAPHAQDAQTPHAQDEIYVVARGTGTFFDGERRRPFAPGTLLFVAAGRRHRFEDCTDDFVVWVMFYGPGDMRGECELAETECHGHGAAIRSDDDLGGMTPCR